MAYHDVYLDPTPQNALKPMADPKVTSLRSALLAYNATSYSQARLNDMTKNDMMHAAKLHGLAIVVPA
jgi:hypothetical protein